MSLCAKHLLWKYPTSVKQCGSMAAGAIDSSFLLYPFQLFFLTCNKRVRSRIFSSDFSRDTTIDSAAFFNCLYFLSSTFFLFLSSTWVGGQYWRYCYCYYFFHYHYLFLVRNDIKGNTEYIHHHCVFCPPTHIEASFLGKLFKGCSKGWRVITNTFPFSYFSLTFAPVCLSPTPCGDFMRLCLWKETTGYL
jgi:hypothetical protein